MRVGIIIGPVPSGSPKRDSCATVRPLISFRHWIMSGRGHTA